MVNEIIIQILDKASLFLDDNNIHKLNNVLIEVLHNINITKQSTELVPITDTYSKIKTFLACKKLEGLSPNSIKCYADVLYKFFNAIQKDYKHMTDMDLRMYLAVKSNQGNKNITLNNQMSPIRSFFDWLYKQDYIAKDPMKAVKTIKIEKRVRKPLSREELEMLRDACKTLRDRAMVECYFSSFGRITELQQLNKDQIDWQNRSTFVIGKGNAERQILFSTQAIYHLKKYLSSRTDDESALFVSERKPHKRLNIRAIQTRFNKLGRYAKIPSSVFAHRLRHTGATTFIQNGGSLYDAQKLLGHKSPSTTDLYIQSCPTMIQESHRQCIN